MKIEVGIIARFIIWIMKTYKVTTGTSIQWFYDNTTAETVQAINNEVIKELSKP